MSYIKPNSVARLEAELAELEGLDKQEDELEEGDEDVTTDPVEDIKEPEKELDQEEETFKKRYSDLRRHNQKVVEDLKAVRAEVEALKKATPQPGLPTAEEAEEWALANPKAAAIIRAIATEQISPSSKEVQEIRTKLDRAEQEALILKKHPDFEEVVQDDAFQDWAEDQPKTMQTLIYSDKAEDVIWALTQYKKETTAAKVNPSKEAAKAVSKTSTPVPEVQTKGRFSESQVQKMSMSDYEKHEADIQKEIKNGTFVYDLSGGAR